VGQRQRASSYVHTELNEREDAYNREIDNDPLEHRQILFNNDALKEKASKEKASNEKASKETASTLHAHVSGQGELLLLHCLRV
jgi:hypothetical protein